MKLILREKDTIRNATRNVSIRKFLFYFESIENSIIFYQKDIIIVFKLSIDNHNSNLNAELIQRREID